MLPGITPNGSSAGYPANPKAAAIVAAWPELPEAVKAGILALVKAATEWSHLALW
jgi:hypothetical protein